VSDETVGSTSAPPAGTQARRVYVEAFGCQMNFLDGELAVSRLSEGGAWTRTDDPEAADMVLFNTCSVRDQSEHRVWSRLGALRERKQRDPSFLIGVMGCMAQREAESILRRMPHVDLVCGTRRFGIMDELVARAESEGQVLAVETEDYADVVRDVRIRPERHRAFVSVMRGCDHKCTYCIVPRTRGTQVDRPVADVIDEVRRLADDGVREITFLGQNINTYGRYLDGGVTLATLLREADRVPGIDRMRFLTSNPMDLRDDLLVALGSLRKACGYLHFPAQHGSDEVLRRMRRGYTRERYLAWCARARELAPGIELASDFIVGFPGESDDEYAATRSLVLEAQFKQIYVFRYSVRPGTAAAALADDVPDDVKRFRNHDLLDLQESISAVRNRRFLGRRIEVLVDGPSARDDAHLTGRDDGNHTVVFDGPASLAGSFHEVLVDRVTASTLYGTLVPGTER
jgi:tRNA-2-methylthio-N6-dimethylallyladenosine synthase